MSHFDPLSMIASDLIPVLKHSLSLVIFVLLS